MKIKSISITNFRGFAETQTLNLADENQITFLVGQNNSGKTLIAKALGLLELTQTNYGESRLLESDLNLFHNNESDNNYITLSITLDDVSLINEGPQYNELELIIVVYNKKNDPIDQDFFQFGRSIKHKTLQSHTYNHSKKEMILNPNDSRALFGSPLEKTINITIDDSRCLDRINNIIESVLSTILIFEPLRHLKYSKSNLLSTSGSGLINWYNNSSNKGAINHVENRIKKLFKQLNLETPTRTDIIHKGDYNYDFEFSFSNGLKIHGIDIGTGYTMLYILLAEIIRNKKQLIIIDEPECHLHPGLLRQLIDIIRDEEIGMAKYIIATHSPTVMQCAKDGDLLYRFHKKEGRCLFESVFKEDGTRNPAKMREVANDLGVLPGDALLSNAVVWVEGPSEVFWLRAWIRAYLPLYQKKKNVTNNLIEGLHYSILFSAGGLIANIDFDEVIADGTNQDESGKLHVLNINPNAFIIIDSDDSDDDGAKTQRAVRIAKQLNNQNKLLSSESHISYIEDEINISNMNEVPNFWRMQARELENYCHPQLLKDFFKPKETSKSKVRIKSIKPEVYQSIYSKEEGIGTILENGGAEGIKAESGTLKSSHKKNLAKYVYENLTEVHFVHPPSNKENQKKFLYPVEAQLDDLTNNLDKMLNYLYSINDLK